MNKKVIRKEVIFITIYKSIEDFLRYLFGIFLIICNFDMYQLTFHIFKKKIMENSSGFFLGFVVNHTQQPTLNTTKVIAILLILFSLIEISFLIALAFRRKYGGIGFFIMQFAWIPIDFLIISRFLLFSRITTIILQAIIVFFIMRLLISPKGYFKK